MLALLAATSLDSATGLAEVIDNIVIERHDSTARIRLHLTSPVHYIRHYISGDGDAVNVYLQALAPLSFGEGAIPDEVRYSPKNTQVPRFTVRVSLDPRCEPVPHPVCIVIQFARATRVELRLGEDRRSLLLELPVASEEDERRASTGERT
ncbi:MAG: hypothetical protein WBO23_13290 [Burkholderiales bacterium]